MTAHAQRTHQANQTTFSASKWATTRLTNRYPPSASRLLPLLPAFHIAPYTTHHSHPRPPHLCFQDHCTVLYLFILLRFSFLFFLPCLLAWPTLRINNLSYIIHHHLFWFVFEPLYLIFVYSCLCRLMGKRLDMDGWDGDGRRERERDYCKDQRRGEENTFASVVVVL
jgi:hypothetical protein